MIMVEERMFKYVGFKTHIEDYSGIEWWAYVFKDSPINDVIRGKGR